MSQPPFRCWKSPVGVDHERGSGTPSTMSRGMSDLGQCQILIDAGFSSIAYTPPAAALNASPNDAESVLVIPHPSLRVVSVYAIDTIAVMEHIPIGGIVQTIATKSTIWTMQSAGLLPGRKFARVASMKRDHIVDIVTITFDYVDLPKWRRRSIFSQVISSSISIL